MEQILYRYNPWWEEDFGVEGLIERTGPLQLLEKNLYSKHVIFITGLRRIGKTSLLKLFIHKLINTKNIKPAHIFFVSLDDYLLQKYNISEIIDHYRGIQKLKYSEKVYLFLDEVTYKEDFEIQLKNLIDNQNVKIITTSSSASHIRNKKPHLTGRQYTIELLPLTFYEYLKFKNITIQKKDKHLENQYFNDYLKTGGVPEYVLTGNMEYLKELVDDILYKDIIAFYHLKDEQLIKDFFLLLMERAGKQISINKIASILSVSPDTARRYLTIFSNCYIIHLMDRYGKTNERILSPKKIYAADLGIRNIFTGYRDFGSLFENYAFLRFKYLHPKYIYQEKTEIDFILNDYLMVETKYHDEEIPNKQKKLLESLSDKPFRIVRNETDIELALSEAERIERTE
ncbi:MAG: ATP-binding protein [Thiohalospira sp.]